MIGITLKTSSGVSPQIIATAPIGSTIDILQGGVIIKTYTLQGAETSHTFDVKLGTYDVRGTLGTKTKTETVLIDEVAQYSVSITYGFYTDFASMQDDWDVQGGTLSFGNGVYVPQGWLGSGSVTDPYARSAYLDIPVSFSGNYEIEWQDNVNANANKYIGGDWVQLLNNDQIVVNYDRQDAWSAANYQNADVLGQAVYTQSTAIVGVTFTNKIRIQNGVATATINGITKTSTLESTEINKVRIKFAGLSTSYPSTATNVYYLKITQL